MIDPLDSGIFPLVLSWIFAVPIFLGALSLLLKPFEPFTKRELGTPRWLPWLVAYFALCIVVISPTRYLMLQFMLVGSYVVQSFGSLSCSFIAGLYFSFVLMVLYAVTVGVPTAMMFAVFRNETKLGILSSIVVAPLSCAIAYALFFFILPYTAWTIHWLPQKDVIRSANGPATVFYKWIVEPDIPRIGPKLIIQEGDTANERLREHVAETYVSAYKRTKQHFIDSMIYFRQVNDISAKQQDASTTIPDDDLKLIVAATKASLKDAERVDTALLNKCLDNFGTIYREQYIPGLHDVIKGIDDSDTFAAVRGELHVHNWGQWYNDHHDAIWAAL